LALLRAGVAREHSFVLERLAELGVVLDQRAGDSETDRAGLARHAAAGDRRENVELVCCLRQHQGSANLRPQRLGGEERLERPVVDADRPGSGTEEHTGGGRLPAARSVVLRCCCHVTPPRAWKVSAPRAGGPDRRTPSTCDTSLRRAL